MKEHFAISSEGDLGRRTLKIGETAKVLGISERSVRRLIQRGELRSVNKLRHILIPAAEISRFLAEND